MKNGGYYPRELENAVKMVFGDEISSVLCEPNNILGVEYIKALNGTGVEPFSVARTGAAHDSRIAGEGFASASHIREMLRNGEMRRSTLRTFPMKSHSPKILTDRYCTACVL